MVVHRAEPLNGMPLADATTNATPKLEETARGSPICLESSLIEGNQIEITMYL